MGLSKIAEGKRNSIKASCREAQGVAPQDRAAHGEMFARPGEPEPNAIRGERPQAGQPRPRRQPTRTRRDAHALGLGGPEALDVTLDELAAEG